jgi:hypothetical protein
MRLFGLSIFSSATNQSIGDASLRPTLVIISHISRRLGNTLLSAFKCIDILAQLPDAFKAFAASQTSSCKAPNDAFMTFCHRELIHAQWKILLDDEFIEAWKHGIVVACCDGVKRRFYLCIFTHAGDYPEKYGTILPSLTFFSQHFAESSWQASVTLAHARAHVVLSLYLVHTTSAWPVTPPTASRWCESMTKAGRARCMLRDDSSLRSNTWLMVWRSKPS